MASLDEFDPGDTDFRGDYGIVESIMSDDLRSISFVSREQNGLGRKSSYSKSSKSIIGLGIRRSEAGEVSDFSEHVLKIAWPYNKLKNAKF